MSRIFEGFRKNRLMTSWVLPGSDGLESNDLSTGVDPGEWPIARPGRQASTLSATTVRLKPPDSSPLPLLDKSSQAAVDEYRTIRTGILHDSRKPQVIAFTSPSAGDGTTVTAINVAASLASTDGNRVLLIDGNLHRPSIPVCLGLPSRPGLAELVFGTTNLDSALICAEQLPNLFLLTAGLLNDRSTELLESQRWRALIQQFRSRFNTIIIDSPPLNSGADYQLIQVMCDGVVLVMRPDSSDRSACIKAFQILKTPMLLGVVLNAVDHSSFLKTSPLPARSPSSGIAVKIRD